MSTSPLPSEGQVALPVVSAQAMSAEQLIESLRALRQQPKDAAFWSRLCVCMSQLCRARYALVLRSSKSDMSWSLLGTNAPADSALLVQANAHIAELSPRALSQGYAYSPCPNGTLLAAVHLMDPAGPTLLLLEIGSRERATINELLIRAQLVADLPADLPAASQMATESQAQHEVSQGLIDLLDLVARVMQESEFGAATLGLVNLLAGVIGCDQAVLGWSEDGLVRVIAISHIDRFERKSENVQLLEAALEEAADQRQDLIFPTPPGSAQVTLAHDRLARRLGYGQLATLVFDEADEAVHAPQMVLLLGRRELGFESDRLHQVSVALHLLRPWLAVLRERSQPLPTRLVMQTKTRLRRWLSPERLRYKALASAAILASLVVVFGTWPYRIEANGELMTDSVQLISSPFDGYLAKVNANLGDTVNQGIVLAELDTRELALQSIDLQSEVRRYQAEADQARAASQAAETQIALARMAQSQARMEQVIFQLKQAQIAAPFTGVIVEGERKELSGSPMRQGDKIFRLARIEGLYALIYVSERDIRELPVNASGELRLLGQPERTIRFTTEKLVPVAQFKGVQAGHFALKVRLNENADWWRPGMAALARIEAGDRRIFWIWTHKLMDTLHMLLWW